MNHFSTAALLNEKEDEQGRGGAAALIEMLIWAAVGFAAANAFLFAESAPFGAASVAASRRRDTLAAAAGAGLGYVFSQRPEGNLRYLAAVIVVLAVKLVFEKVKEGEWLSVITAAGAVGAVSLAFSIMSGAGTYGVFMAAAESVLAGGGTYFLFRSRLAMQNRQSLSTLSSTDRACVIVTAAIAAAALTGVSFGRISLGRIAACFVIMLAARFGRESAGAIAGVATGSAVSLAAAKTGWLIGFYGLGGLMAGIFSVFGRIGIAAAFLITQLLGIFLESGAYPDFSPIYEGIIAASVFLVLPIKMPRVAALFSVKEAAEADSETVKSLLIARLGAASEGLSEIADATHKVSRSLTKNTGLDMGAVYNSAAERVCRSCSKNAVCWGKNYSDTMNAFMSTAAVLKNGGSLTQDSFSGAFADYCPKRAELAEQVSRQYEDFIARRLTSHHISHVREVVTDQFEGLSVMLSDLSEELSCITGVDKKLTASVKRCFENKALAPISVVCWNDENELLTIEAAIPKFKQERIDKAELTEDLTQLCLRELGEPVIRELEESVRVIITEKPTVTLDYGFAQKAANGARFCGDSCEYFLDEHCRGHMILSDGMGSGAAAALDSAMTAGLLARMIKAGFRFGSALRVVNSALLVKSGEESLATADAATVDLFSGVTTFCKAGAAPSFVLRSGRPCKVEAMSMPAGILGGVTFEEDTLKLSAGDIIVLVSDGVTASGEDWIGSELRALSQKSAGDIAKSLMDTAYDRRSDGHEDDITVLVARIEQGV